jgi:hypothetical protein
MVNDADRLPLTPAIITLLFTSYYVSQRFIDLLWWQHMPGRATHHDEHTQKPIEHGKSWL